MQIISKKRLQFNDYEISINQRSNEKVAKLVRSFIAGPSLRAIEAPDWIVNDDLFELAVKDGSLIAIGDIPTKQLNPIPEPQQIVSESKQDQQNDEQLAEILSRPISEITASNAAPANYPTTSKGWPSTKSI
jgi:hypothetical protein